MHAMQCTKVLLLVVGLTAWCCDARAVAREDVKGVKTLLQDEQRDDPFFDNNPQYDFAYRIHDEETGDAKDQSEERRGDTVQGSYSVVDPDGTLRVVKYTANDQEGFNAVVSLTPGHAKPYVPPIRSGVQRRVGVFQNHVDIPVPVQHHVLQTASEQTVGNQRVVVRHPFHKADALTQQHLVQPPLALGQAQDVFHFVPQAPYQLHQLHQVPTAGIHHQMALPLSAVHVQNPAAPQNQGMITAVLQLLQMDQTQLSPQQQQQIQGVLKLAAEQQMMQDPSKVVESQKQTQLLLQSVLQLAAQPQDPAQLAALQQMQGAIQLGAQQQDPAQLAALQQMQGAIQLGAQQQDPAHLAALQQRQGAIQLGAQQQDPLKLAAQQQLDGAVQLGAQQQVPQQLVGDINLRLGGIQQQLAGVQVGTQGTQDDVKLVQKSDIKLATQQQDTVESPQQDQPSSQQESSPVVDEQQDNKIQEADIVSALPQVIEVRHSVQKVDSTILPNQQQQLQLQLRSLDGEPAQPAYLPSNHRTTAVYRTSPQQNAHSTSFVSFSSPYAQYTIS